MGIWETRSSRGMMTKVWPVGKLFKVMNKCTRITCVTFCYICSELAIENTRTKSFGYLYSVYYVFIVCFFRLFSIISKCYYYCIISNY